MRILMVSDVYFPRVNGVSTSIQTFRSVLEAKGHEVGLIAPHYPVGQTDEERVHRIASRYVPLDPEDRMMRRKAIRRLEARLAAVGYDIVHIQTPFVAHYAGVALARRLHCPTVESYHTFFEEYLYHYVSFLPKAWLRFAARRFSTAQCNEVNGLVVPSQAMLDVLRQYGVDARAEIIPTGINLQQFAAGDGARFRQQHGIAPGRPTLLYVGRVVFEKNIEFLLAVTEQVKRQVPDILLVIAGEGPALESLQREARRRGLEHNSLFVGYLQRNGALMDCYRCADAFVFASRTETQGLVLLEAMALGVPVVSTAVMGTKEILRDGEGCLVAQEDVADFGAKVIRLLGDAELRRRLAASAREYARAWGEEQFAEKLLAFYGDVIGDFGLARQSGRLGAVAQGQREG